MRNEVALPSGLLLMQLSTSISPIEESSSAVRHHPLLIISQIEVLSILFELAGERVLSFVGVVDRSRRVVVPRGKGTASHGLRLAPCRVVRGLHA